MMMRRRKQMKKLGEPPRKVQRRTNDPEAEEITQNPPVKDTASEMGKDGAEPRQETTARVSKQTRAQKREKRELRTKKRKEREENKKKKKKATEDRMKLLGELRTKNQPKILSWTVRQVGVSQRTPKGGRKGIG